jgi:hypothetical protein
MTTYIWMDSVGHNIYQMPIGSEIKKRIKIRKICDACTELKPSEAYMVASADLQFSDHSRCSHCTEQCWDQGVHLYK